MAYIKKMIETKTSNVSFWRTADPAWETYRKEVYENTGKLTIIKQVYLANNATCAPFTEDSRKRMNQLIFDSVETCNQFEKDFLGFDNALKNKKDKEQFYANNSITIEILYETVET